MKSILLFFGVISCLGKNCLNFRDKNNYFIYRKINKILLICSEAEFLKNANDWKIVGGQQAEENQFPYIISLRMGDRHRCGGSILNPHWILTAAHCVIQINPDRLTVVVGSTKLDAGGQRYKVAKTFHHQNYSAIGLHHDVGLVKVESSIDFNEGVTPIAPETEYLAGGEEAVLCGWGTTTYPGSTPNDLQYINLTVISQEACQEKQSTHKIYESEICTLTKAGEGACHGDSGGPLVSEGRQIGIVSWGRPCARGYPDVFTRVSSFIDWIDETIQVN